MWLSMNLLLFECATVCAQMFWNGSYCCAIVMSHTGIKKTVSQWPLTFNLFIYVAWPLICAFCDLHAHPWNLWYEQVCVCVCGKTHVRRVSFHMLVSLTCSLNSHSILYTQYLYFCHASLLSKLEMLQNMWNYARWFLAATKQLCKWYFPSVRLSVRLSHLFYYLVLLVSSWGQRSRSQTSKSNLTVSGLYLQFEFTYDDEMMHTAWFC